MQDDRPKFESARPRWLRYLLFAIVVLLAGVAFYFNNLRILERLNQ